SYAWHVPGNAPRRRRCRLSELFREGQATWPLAAASHAGLLREAPMFHLLWVVVIGLIVGVIAKLLMPGRDPGGFIITILLGIAGSLVGTFIGRALWGGADYSAGWVTSILGAVLLLALYRAVAVRR